MYWVEDEVPLEIAQQAAEHSGEVDLDKVEQNLNTLQQDEQQHQEGIPEEGDAPEEYIPAETHDIKQEIAPNRIATEQEVEEESSSSTEGESTAERLDRMNSIPI